MRFEREQTKMSTKENYNFYEI